jgi:DNA-binding HxlR family transcriptional regulator
MTYPPPLSAMRELCQGDPTALAPMRDVLDRVGDKWSLLILGMLDRAPQRFTVLHRSIPGISQRMLTHTLRNLQRDGLVSRESFAEIPPRVEYTVTPLGQTLLPAVIALATWAFENQGQLQANRDDYDDAREAG